jgi:hypothetical protein
MKQELENEFRSYISQFKLKSALKYIARSSIHSLKHGKYGEMTHHSETLRGVERLSFPYNVETILPNGL